MRDPQCEVHEYLMPDGHCSCNKGAHANFSCETTMEKAAEDLFGPRCQVGKCTLRAGHEGRCDPEEVADYFAGLHKDLKQRNASYGKFENTSRVSQELKCALRAGTSWHRLPVHQREALEMIMSKASRIVNGDCGEQKDSWYDIAGFAKLGSGDFG